MDVCLGLELLNLIPFVLLGVPLDIIASFSRMKKLSEELDVIRTALSQESQVIELNEEKTHVHRKTSLPESRETLARAVYVSGFPLDASLDDLQEFFAQHSQLVEAIRFRRTLKEREFKGSVFVEFASAEEALRFAGLDLQYREKPLTIKTKMSYFAQKNEEATSKRSQSKNSALLEKMGRGRLVKIVDFPAQGITHEALKEALKDIFPIAYVDFNYESGCAWIRFREASAEAFAAAYNAETPLEIGEFKITNVHIADEEEQAKYYDAMVKPRKTDKRGKGRDNNSNKRRADEPVEDKDAQEEPKKAKGDIVELDEAAEQ